MSTAISITEACSGLSLTELAAHAVIEASKRLDERKIPLSDEAKRRLHGVWIDIKTALSDTSIPQIMNIIEKEFAAQLVSQQPKNAMGLASKIESLWEQLTKKIGSTFLPISIDSCRSVHKQWENEALEYLWGAISEKIDQSPNLTTIQAIEAWVEDPINDETLESIQEIAIFECPIRAFPPRLLKCPQLQKIFLFKNQITSLPEWFGTLSQLRIHEDTDLSRLQ